MRENFVLALRIRPASPISAEGHVAPIILAVAANHANSIGATSLAPLRLLIQNLPIIFTMLTGNGNMAKPRWNLNKTTKERPAPQSEAPTLLLTLFSTHLSFRWTLPLRYYVHIRRIPKSFNTRTAYLMISKSNEPVPLLWWFLIVIFSLETDVNEN
jgi:hypothetical protein